MWGVVVAAAWAADIEVRGLAELQAAHPEAAAAWDAANLAHAAGQHERAISGFSAVIAAAPTMEAAWRARAVEELALDRVDAARADAAEAWRLDPSADNAGVLVRARTTGRAELPRAERTELGVIAETALRDPAAAWTACSALLPFDADTEFLARCDAAIVVGPERVRWAATRAALAHDLDRLRALGAEVAGTELAGPVATAIAEEEAAAARRARMARLRSGVVWAVVAWLGSFPLLLGVGHLLSLATIASSSRMLLRPDRAALGPGVRVVYQAVLGLLCVSWFASLPVVAVAVLVVAALLAAGSLLALRVSPRPIVVAYKTLWALIRALLVELPRPPVDLELDLGTQPAFAAWLADIAARSGASPVDAVLLAPGVECTVYGEASVIGQLLGRQRRCLVIGVDLLRNATRRQLRPILAHEHGHFVNGDLSVGPFATAVRRSLERLQTGLEEEGVADRANPAWWFVRAFDRVFSVASHGASRLAELQADRRAALVYGSDGLVAALRFYIERQLCFEELVDGVLREAVAARRPLRNFYTTVPRRRLAPAALAARVDEVVNRPATAGDSHPPPAVRFAWVQALGPGGRDDDPLGDRPVWSLLVDGTAIEERMTARIRALLQDAHGITLRG